MSQARLKKLKSQKALLCLHVKIKKKKKTKQEEQDLFQLLIESIAPVKKYSTCGAVICTSASSLPSRSTILIYSRSLYKVPLRNLEGASAFYSTSTL